MAEIVLGLGSSHTPLLALPGELWSEYAKGDRRNGELVYPPNGWTMPFEEALEYLPEDIKLKKGDEETFLRQSNACQAAIRALAKTLQAAQADITIIISDDQDEWFYENNMPQFAVFWGDMAPLRPRRAPAAARSPELIQRILEGYGDKPVDVPVASKFGRFLIEYMVEHDFDVAHFNYVLEEYGGRIARRYPKRGGGELDYIRESQPHPQGLPHGFAYVVHRLYDDQPRTILPVFQNTCYPPNQPTPKRSFDFGRAIAGAVKAWPEDVRVAIVGSGGLSHFVVDEELDRALIKGLDTKDPEILRSLPRQRLYSAASETLNWVALGGAMQDTALKFDLVDYVPVYRTEAATGGGWCFARWQ